jgi:serine/threonine-protein kinase
MAMAHPPDSPRDLAPGSVFAGYRIERRLAQGASSTLYVAVDLRDDNPVAVKILSLGEGADERDAAELRQRFLREAQAAARLRHPDIVTVYGGGESQGLAFIVMELLGGTDLVRYTRPSRLLPEPVVLGIVERVARALAHAHRAGLVHRDVKPANILVDLPHRQVKITDFGTAQVIGAERTRSGLVLGTPAFMSPEQLAGGAVDGRSDLYSLGVMLFQLLTGELPYEATSLGHLLRQVAQAAPRPLRSLRPDLPASLEAVLSRVLQKAPGLRHADGDALADDLRRVAADPGWPQPPDFGSQEALALGGMASDPGHNGRRSG